jgi:hypothetical protein
MTHMSPDFKKTEYTVLQKYLKDNFWTITTQRETEVKLQPWDMLIHTTTTRQKQAHSALLWG